MSSSSFLRLAAQAHIGSDETLKGDTFGGIVVCACYMPDTHAFLHMGILDSKKLTEQTIRRLGKQLLATHEQHFAIAELEPAQYNAVTSQQTVTQLLNSLHETVAQTLRERHGAALPHLVDEYPGCTIGDARAHRAEQDSLAVAAASIVARYKGLLQFERLSAQAGFTLPMGSTHVQDALLRLHREGQDFNCFAKLHFKNVAKVLHTSSLGSQTKLSDDFD
jgi:ribonuclease HIII